MVPFFNIKNLYLKCKNFEVCKLIQIQRDEKSQNIPEGHSLYP